ncbi:MAG TPA: hypothetical protein VGK64_23885 [Bryobacteraceae bacterium]
MREWQDPLDEMLDGALASYGEAPEREGLERRVLAKVNQRAQRRRRSIGRFAVPIGAAAAAVGCLLWWAMPDIATHPSPTITAADSAAVPPPATKPPVTRRPAAKLRRAPKRPAAPKLSQFPAPTPMSSEERALLRLATGDPKYIPRELTRAGTDIAPLRIAAIEIKPLE